MELNYAMGYRITMLELEQAAIRAERARVLAENPDMIVRREGMLRRALRRIWTRRADAVPAAPAALEVPGLEAAASGAASAEVLAIDTPVAVIDLASAAPMESAVEEARAGELVGCTPHAA